MTFVKTIAGYKPDGCQIWTQCFCNFCENYIDETKKPGRCCSINEDRIDLIMCLKYLRLS